MEFNPCFDEVSDKVRDEAQVQHVQSSGQLRLASQLKAPEDGCSQYHAGLSGHLDTFRDHAEFTKPSRALEGRRLVAGAAALEWSNRRRTPARDRSLSSQAFFEKLLQFQPIGRK